MTTTAAATHVMPPAMITHCHKAPLRRPTYARKI
jgi:hypothetical protein